jgi:spoIIIJ-associated protein
MSEAREPGSLPDSPAERAVVVVERTLAALEVGGRARVSETDEEIEVLVEGEDDSALLIGKHGATIDALQHVVARVAFRGRERERKPVVIDAAGYRERRQAALERAAERAADEALSFGRAVELDPMSSFERRVVHNHLAERSDVETHSEGDEPDRRLVVTPQQGGSRAR